MSEPTRRTLAADDYEAIHNRMQELREGAKSPESGARRCKMNYWGHTCPSGGYCIRRSADGGGPRCVDFGSQPATVK